MGESELDHPLDRDAVVHQQDLLGHWILLISRIKMQIKGAVQSVCRPSARGARARPMNPANVTIVRTYGSIWTAQPGTPTPDAWSAIWSASATPNSRHAAAAHAGRQLPKI